MRVEEENHFGADAVFLRGVIIEVEKTAIFFPEIKRGIVLLRVMVGAAEFRQRIAFDLIELGEDQEDFFAVAHFLLHSFEP